jgi:hypothetical protein
MARRVYFSFHYEGDVWRANQVRNSWVTKPNREPAGFQDAAEFEAVKRRGDKAVEQWIDRNMQGTSVTVVLVGENTCNRYWVRYELQRSIDKKNGIIFIRIHNLKDQAGNTCPEGAMDFGDIDVSGYPVYDWVNDDGYNNIGDWVEASAAAAGRDELGPPAYRNVGRPGKGCGRL